MEATQPASRPGVIQTMQENLEKQTQLCKGFLCLLKEEQNALIAMDVEALMRYSRKKIELLEHIHQLDKSIGDETRELADANRLKSGGLATIIPLLPPDMAAQLAGFTEELTLLREEITARNLVNKHFTEETLTCLNDALALITGGGGNQTAYAPRRNSMPKTCDPALVSREV